MAMPGRPQKPAEERRNRVKPVHDWTEVDNVPFEDAPAMPRHPSEVPIEVPEPPEGRPLGKLGAQTWAANYWTVATAADRELLLLVCEQLDDRLRLRVQAKKDPRLSSGLNRLEVLISNNLRNLGLSNEHANTRPMGWPEATIEWWKAISVMPHCVLWGEGDWQFARDTMLIVAAYHVGHVHLANELRRRENMMGVTADARRNLRIRYVDPELKVVGAPARKVSSLDDRRRQLVDSESESG